jgi:hypothetical protein
MISEPLSVSVLKPDSRPRLSGRGILNYGIVADAASNLAVRLTEET